MFNIKDGSYYEGQIVAGIQTGRGRKISKEGGVLDGTRQYQLSFVGDFYFGKL